MKRPIDIVKKQKAKRKFANAVAISELFSFAMLAVLIIRVAFDVAIYYGLL